MSSAAWSRLAQVIRDTAGSLLEGLAGERSLLSVLQTIGRSHAFRMSIEQAQETSECCPAPPAWLDQLGFESLSWCVWGDMQQPPLSRCWLNAATRIWTTGSLKPHRGAFGKSKVLHTAASALTRQ